jgi:UDP-glucose 4-epimerase
VRILVTGASGFLGLNVLKQLSESRPQAAIVAADLHRPASEELAALGDAARSVVFKPLDVGDPEACLRLVADIDATHILHAAAVTLTEETAAAVDLTKRVNLQGTDNILKAAAAAKTVQRCLFLSSSGVYAQTGDNPACAEDDPLRLDSEYASSKGAAELRMNSYEAGAFVVASARVSPVYGPFERSRDTRPRVSLIRRLLDFLLDGRPIRIGGADLSRDWTHAADIAAALEALLVSPRLNHRVYNVGSGSSASAREVVALFIEAGLQVRWTDEAPDIFLDPRDSRKPLAIMRLQRDTGFAPRFDIRAGIAAAIAAESARRAGYGIHRQEKQAT